MPSSNLKLRTPTPLILHFIKVSPQARAGEDDTDNVLKKDRPMTKEITRNICSTFVNFDKVLWVENSYTTAKNDTI